MAYVDMDMDMIFSLNALLHSKELFMEIFVFYMPKYDRIVTASGSAKDISNVASDQFVYIGQL